MTEPASASAKAEVKTDHIRKAIVVVGGFLVVICLVVLIKGVLTPPRTPSQALDAPPAAAQPQPAAELSAYQEKLQQYRRSQPRAEDRDEPAGSAGGTAPSSPEDQNFVKQQLRMPMLVKDAAQGQAVPSPQPPPLPVAPAAAPDPALQQRLAGLQKRLAELRYQQQRLQDGGGPK